MGDTPYLHDTILNRLDTYQQYGNRKVLLSRGSFAGTDDWTNIPVLFAQDVGDGDLHPDFDNVELGVLPPGCHQVGYVEKAYIPREGATRLAATLAITDSGVQPLAKAGLLGISTGFTCPQEPETVDEETGVVLTYRLTGRVQPNHVLVFVQGETPNSYGRDNAAMFINTIEGVENTTMTETEVKEDIGLIKRMMTAIHDKFCNTAEAAPAPVASEPVVAPAEPEVQPVEPTLEAPTLEAPVEEPVTEEAAVPSLEEENAQLKAQLEEMKAAQVQAAKDAEWDKVKAKCPEGWLGAKEQDTRKQFEENPVDFAMKLLEHKAEFKNTVAEGVASVPAEISEEQKLKNEFAEVRAKTGYTFNI